MGLTTAIIGGAAVLGAGASAYSAYESGEAADEATYEMASATDAQMALAQSQWKRYLQKFAPLEDKMVEEVSKPLEQQPGYLGAMGQLEKGYASTGANLRRTMAGRYPYGGGAEVLPQSTLALSKPLARAGVYGQANQNLLANRLNVAGLGRNLPAIASSGYGNVAAGYGNLANVNNQAAAGTWGGLGNTAGNLMQTYMLSEALKKNPYVWGGIIPAD